MVAGASCANLDLVSGMLLVMPSVRQNEAVLSSVWGSRKSVTDFGFELGIPGWLAVAQSPVFGVGNGIFWQGL